MENRSRENIINKFKEKKNILFECIKEGVTKNSQKNIDIKRNLTN